MSLFLLWCKLAFIGSLDAATIIIKSPLFFQHYSKKNNTYIQKIGLFEIRINFTNMFMIYLPVCNISLCVIRGQRYNCTVRTQGLAIWS